jgi:ketosteroid isomerase-like protein
MSQENVDMLRRGYEAFARRDLDAALEMMDPKIEAHDAPEIPDATMHRGREAVRRDWEQMFDLFEDFRIDIEEVFDADEELVVFLRLSGRGRESGVEVDARMAHVWTAREGKAIRLRQYLDRAEALKAVGLSEQDAHAGS